MEVVLSPGRFGDEGSSGGPFQNEEIREWSHVDRLTGMLERARVETGRWQTSNQGAARSYGKVIDSRERNSADGSVVQRARRQVEVFQSQAPGRSVQVVRASQWSSSRVTDSTTNGPLSLSPATQSQSHNEEKRLNGLGGPFKLTSPPSSFRRDEAISERLSSLLGSFAYSASSTVPLRRIDSKYSSRTPISLTASKRFSSNENVSTIGESRLDLSSSARSPRESSKTIAPSVDKEDFAEIFRKRAEDNRGNEQVANVRVQPEEAREQTSQEAKVPGKEKKNSPEETRSAASRAKAIHLLPSSKANTTVVNLINTSDPWMPSSSQPSSETARVSDSKPGESARTKMDEASTAASGRTKRVGFCKTEIHFAADSGKVNIVETDGKPPPTNKFRRRRRNSVCNKSVPNVSREAIEYADAPKKDGAGKDEPVDDPTKNDPNLHRGHTTTVNLGADLNAKNQLSERGFPEGRQRAIRSALEATSQGILLRLENRIYDRLESYTSDLRRGDSSPAAKNVHQSALKSARLVLNVTRNPSGGRVSKITIENEEKGSTLPTAVTEKKTQEEAIAKGLDDDYRDEYLDWEADNEVQSIMLGSSDDGREFEFCQTSSTERENAEENAFSSQIVTEEASEIVSKASEETIGTSSLPSAVPTGSSSKPEARESSKDDYDVLCTDADNNKVLLKVITTHEPTIARVESDHRLRKRASVGNVLPTVGNSLPTAGNVLPPAGNILPSVGNVLPTVGKKEIRSACAKLPKNDAQTREHTYVNVFTGSKRAPIYENYKISESESPDARATVDAKTEKMAHDPKCQKFVVAKKTIESEKSEKTKTVAETKMAAGLDAEESSGGGKKARNKTKDVKLPVKVKSARPEVASSNSTSGTARVRSSRNVSPKVPLAKRSSSRAQEGSALSTERVSRTSGGSSNSGSRANGSRTARDVVASVKAVKKNEGATRQKPMEVVYQTAVYNMKNERLSRPQKGKEPKGPRYLNELICGAKTKRPSESKNKTSSAQNAADKGALQTIRHWK